MSENRRRNSQSPGLTMKEIAELVGGKLEGDGGLWVSGIGPVDEADAGQMAFLARKRYARYAPGSRASSFLVSSDLQVYVPSHAPRIIVEEPYRVLRTLLKRFHPPQPHSARVHPTAVIGLGVELGNGVSVGPYAVIEDDAQIGDGCRIGPHCVIGRGSSLGKECLLHPQVVTYEETVIGDRVVVHSGVRLGSDGFGFTLVDDVHLKIPQVGRCVIEDDVEIGANATIDRGSLGDTVVGRGSKTDNLVHLAHNVKVGAGSLFAALVGVAGSTRIGKGVWMGGQVGVSDHLDIGDGARLAIATKLMRDVPGGQTVSGHPAREHREQLKKQANLSRLPSLVERIGMLEEKLADLLEGEVEMEP